MPEFFGEFQKAENKTHSTETINSAIAVYKTKTTLTKRLAELLLHKVKLDDPNDNPWYTEMQEANINIEQITIIKDYLKFKKTKEEQLLKEYKKSKRGFSYSPNYCMLPPHYKKNAYFNIKPEKDKTIILGE